MSKKVLFLVLAVVAVVALSILSFRFFYGAEDDWICQNGQWVRHGNPSAPMPTTFCGGDVVNDKIDETGVPKKQTNTAVEYDDNGKVRETRLYRPSAGQMLVSPLKVQGEMPSSWYFEANALVRLVDSNGKEIVASSVQATEDWMQPNKSIPFEAQLEFRTPETATGFLILNNDNPSGLPQYSKSETYPVRFWQIVKVYFNQKDDNICEDVTTVDIYIKPTVALGRAALERLLEGPTEAEKKQGFLTMIPEGVKIQSLTIKDGVAKVDFNAALEKSVGGSCRVSGIRAQITETLKQFPTVKSVVISIDGRTEDILQP